MLILWIVVFAAFVVLESLTVSLTSIWFSGGALGALAVLVLGGGVRLQLTVFVLVSFALLILVRPVAARCMKGETKKQEQDGLIGRRVMVKTRIDNQADAGTAVYAGETWLARSDRDQVVLEAGEQAVITAVQGARLYVRPVSEPE